MANGYTLSGPGFGKQRAYITPAGRAARQHTVCTGRATKKTKKQDNESTLVWRGSGFAGSSVASDALIHRVVFK